MTPRPSAVVSGGGLGSAGMGRSSHQTGSLVYQSNVKTLALRELIANVARSLRPYAKTRQERQVCDDAGKGHRLSFASLETLVRLAAQSDRPFCLEAAIREAVIGELAGPPRSAREANERETHANELLNPAQLLAEREDSPTRWLTVGEFAAYQEWTSRELKDAAFQRARRVVAS